MLIGKLKRKITIQKKTISRSATGGEIFTWSDRVTVSCKVRPLEYKFLEHPEFRADRYKAGKFDEFNIRYRTDIEFEDRIIYNGYYYNILSISEVGHRRGLQIRAAWHDTSTSTKP